MFSRGFWTLKGAVAAFGVLITVGVGAAHLLVGDRLRETAAVHEEAARSSESRIRAIDEAVFEFKLFETQATFVEAMMFTSGADPQLREPLRALAAGARRRAFLVILSEVRPDPEAFRAALADYDRAMAGLARGDVALAREAIAMESAEIQAAHALQRRLVDDMFEAREASRETAARLARYATLATTTQLLGLVIVLLGNLLADHRARGSTGGFELDPTTPDVGAPRAEPR